jgi:hypothetical protein
MSHGAKAMEWQLDTVVRDGTALVDVSGAEMTRNPGGNAVTVVATAPATRWRLRLRGPGRGFFSVGCCKSGATSADVQPWGEKHLGIGILQNGDGMSRHSHQEPL